MKCAPAWNAAFASRVLAISRGATRSNVSGSNVSPKNSDFSTGLTPMPSLRLQRVRELLKRELGEIIRREIPVGEAGLITVSEVNVRADLQTAAVYVGIIGSAEQQKKGLPALNKHCRHIQGQMGKAIVLKYTPPIRF